MPIRHPRLRRLLGAAVLLTVASTTSATNQVLLVTQTITGPREGLVSTLVARVSSVLPTRREVTLAMDGRPLADGAGITPLAARDYGTWLTSGQLLSDAKTHLFTSAPALAASIRRAMQANGVGTANFSLMQRVVVAGTATPQILVWSMVVYRSERPVFGDPRLVPSIETTLHVVHTPLRVAAGLPVGWAYPDAGTLQWRILDRQGAPLTGWSSITIGNAYDEPESNGGAVDPDRGLKCLLAPTTTIGCPRAVANVASLMNQTGHTRAIVDYRRALQPAYDQIESPPGSRRFEQVARVAVAVNRRELAPSSCGAGEYRNEGAYGFELAEQVERYAATIEGSYVLIDRFAHRSVSPSVPFKVAKQLNEDATAAQLADKLIDPANPGGALIAASTVRGLVGLAPITTTKEGASAAESFVIGDIFHGACGRAVQLAARCSATGQIELSLGMNHAVPGCSPRSMSFSERAAVTLKRGVPLRNQVAAFEGMGSVPWSYDGDRSVIFHAVPVATDAGTTLAPSVFAAQLFAPNVGYYVRENFPNGGPLDFYLEHVGCPSGQVAGAMIGLEITQCYVADAGSTATGCQFISAGDGAPFESCQRYRTSGVPVTRVVQTIQ